MPSIEKGQAERILRSCEVLKIVCELFDRIPKHERHADLNFLISKYESNPEQEKRDAKWTWRQDREHTR